MQYLIGQEYIPVLLHTIFSRTSQQFYSPIHRASWILWTGTVEWNGGMDYRNGILEWTTGTSVGFARMRIRAMSCPRCLDRLGRTGFLSLLIVRVHAAMAIQGSGTAGSPIRLDDSPAGKSHSELPLDIALSASPVKVLQGDQFRWEVFIMHDSWCSEAKAIYA